jgi:hypothetical protein
MSDELGIPGVTGLVELARTGAAVTYRGTDGAGRRVIVKVLQRDAAAEVRARFDYDQARLAELVEHPDIVVTLGHGYTTANQPFLVTEEVTAGSLADRVGSGMDGPGVLSIGVKLAGALESAHRRNLVHGDLRPEDVLVTDDGEPHLNDLGVALVSGWGPDRATDPDRVAHAAPEQLDTHLPTPATDVYALGSLLHALLSGRPAFVRPGDTTAMAVALRIKGEPAPDLRSTGVPEPVIDVIEKAMAKDPAARWASAEAMGHALQQAEVTLGLPITPMTVIGAELNPPRPDVEDEAPAEPAAPDAEPAAAKSSRKGGLLLLALLLVVAAVVAGVVLLTGGDDDDDVAGDGFDRPEEVDVDLTPISDDDGVITVGVIARWDDVDGRNLEVADDVVTPDLVASEDAGTFLDAGSFDVSGIEITVMDADALAASDLELDAGAILDARVDGRNLADGCTTDRPATDEEIAGFAGQLRRFEGCDGASLVAFAGVDAGRALVIEAHLVDADDEAAIDAVLASIVVGD